MAEFNHIDFAVSLKNGDVKVFESIYDHFSDRLLRFAYSRVRDKEQCEEMVQEVFLSLWNNRETLQIFSTLEAYLFGAIKHKILNYIRSDKVRKKYASEFTHFMTDQLDNSIEELMDMKDLQHAIEVSIAELPERCQTAFRLSRFEHESIQQIAERMKISTGTVENYISQALKHLRANLEKDLVWLVVMSTAVV